MQIMNFVKPVAASLSMLFLAGATLMAAPVPFDTIIEEPEAMTRINVAVYLNNAAQTPVANATVRIVTDGKTVASGETAINGEADIAAPLSQVKSTSEACVGEKCQTLRSIAGGPAAWFARIFIPPMKETLVLETDLLSLDPIE